MFAICQPHESLSPHVSSAMKLHFFDLGVVVLYFSLIVAVGLYFSRRNRTAENYFLGRRDFPGWAVGISFIGLTISSVTFVAYPGDSFKTAWLRFLPNLAFPFVVLIAAYVFVPFFRKGIVTSAYQYLGLRFGPSISLYAGVVYMVAQIVRSATITYLLSVLLSYIIGLPVSWCILMAAGITAIYTIKGGFEAVIWTEVVQTIILILGATTCIGIIIFSIPGGVLQIISEAWEAGKLSFQDLNAQSGQLEPVKSGFSFSEKTTLMLILVGVSQYIAGQLDQDTVQRWCSARSAKDARKSMFILGLGALPIWASFMFLGTCLWVYYLHHPSPVAAEMLSGTAKSENILPYFIVTVLPHGVAGLVISAALAAAMSSLSSCINATTMVWINDVYRKYFVKDAEESFYLRAGKWSSLGLTFFIILGAYVFHFSSTKTLMDFSIAMTALFGGGISGAFLLGMFTRVGDARAVLIAIAATLAFTTYAFLAQINVAPRIFDPYYTSIIANVIMFATGLIAARLLPKKARDLRNLTIWDQKDVYR